MAGTLRYVRGRSIVIIAGLGALLLTGCGGNDDGSGTDDPLIEEGSNVIPSGTGPGTNPVPPDSTVTGAGMPGPGTPAGTPGGTPGSTPQDTSP